jgi:UPF0755 protein
MIKKLFKLLLLLIIITGAIAAWYWQEYQTFLQTPIQLNTSEDSFFTVKKGTTVNQLARQLSQQHIIQNPLFFKLYARLSKQANKIKRGEYSLQNGMTVVDLMELFVSGKVNQYSLTLVEGWSIKQVFSHLKQNPHIQHTLGESMDKDTVKRILDDFEIKGNQLEGLFYPDTYLFPKNTTDISFLIRASKTMQHILAKEWKNRDKDLPLTTPYEALILASIVEKESGLSSERDKIAGVFIRRIKKGMRLQSDPTIIYGMGDKYNGNIRRRDINKKTAYNTYQIDGLPPTPIAIPGRDAIHAVMHPDKDKSLYFVADGSGGHAFSNTLKQHNKAVRKYILKK